MTEQELRRLLHRHYQPPDRRPQGVWAQEITSPDGRRRADALFMPTTIAGGQGLYGHEIKVSRSDVMVELADATKAEPWAQYCTHWWLVVADAALVHGLTIPDAWGVMAPPSGRRTRSMTIVRPAPKLKPREPAPAYERIARWMLYSTHDAEAQLRSERHHQRQTIDRLHAQVDEMRAQLAAAGVSRHDERASRVSDILAAIDQRAQPAPWTWRREITTEMVADAVVDQAQARRAARELEGLLKERVRHFTKLVAPLTQSGFVGERLQQLLADCAVEGGVER